MVTEENLESELNRFIYNDPLYVKYVGNDEFIRTVQIPKNETLGHSKDEQLMFLNFVYLSEGIK